MLETPYTYLHDDYESQLGCSDMPVVYVMLILVRVTRGIAEISVPESSAWSQELGLGICSTALWPEGGARHVPASSVQNSQLHVRTAMGKILSAK